MAVALAGTQGQDNGTSQNPTFNFTPSSAPTGVGVGVVWKDEDANVTITSVTYGGNAMTLEDSQAFQSNKMKAALYSLGNPPSGLQAVQVNFSAAPDRESCHCVVAVTGGDTSDVFGTPVKATGVSAFPTVSGIASSPNEWCMDIAGASNTGAMGTVSAGQTERMDVALASAAGGCSTEAGNTTVNMGWTLSGSTDWGIIGASFKVAGVGGTGKTFYLIDTLFDGWLSLSESASNVLSTTCWTVGTGSINHSSLESAVNRPESTFTDTTQPDGSLNATLHDAWRTESKYTGNFASGNWIVNAAVRSGEVSGTHDGALVFRLLRSANTDGSGAVEITTQQEICSTVTDLTTSNQITSMTWNPGAFSVSNEYLFFQIAWKRVGAGAVSNSDVRFRTTSSTITTSNFTSTLVFERSAAFFHTHVAGLGGITNV